MAGLDGAISATDMSPIVVQIQDDFGLDLSVFSPDEVHDIVHALVEQMTTGGCDASEFLDLTDYTPGAERQVIPAR